MIGVIYAWLKHWLGEFVGMPVSQLAHAMRHAKSHSSLKKSAHFWRAIAQMLAPPVVSQCVTRKVWIAAQLRARVSADWFQEPRRKKAALMKQKRIATEWISTQLDIDRQPVRRNRNSNVWKAASQCWQDNQDGIRRNEFHFRQALNEALPAERTKAGEVPMTSWLATFQML